MGIRIWIGGGLGVDDPRDILNVDPPRGDVGRDERIKAAALEFREGAIALSLLHLS